MKKIKFLLLFLGLGFQGFSQNGIGNEEITITKSREVEIQKADRIYEKIPAVSTKREKVPMVYNFYERKPEGIEEVKFDVNVISPAENSNKKETVVRNSVQNFIRIGAGNYGRIYGEGFFNSDPSKLLEFGAHYIHNSIKKGPIKDDFSGASDDKLRLFGTYHSDVFKLSASGSYQLKNYTFYGYDTTSLLTESFTKDNIKQRLNIVNFGVGIENTNPKSVFDYQLKTNFRSLNDYYSAQETDWVSTFVGHIPIVENQVTGVIQAEADITQQSDQFSNVVDGSITRSRNLFRVVPKVNFNLFGFSADLGLRYVFQKDLNNNLDKSYFFPTITVNYKAPNLIYLFGGYDGDINRNTLGSFLEENPFLQPQINVINTEKPMEVFLGARGDMPYGFSFNLKGSFGQYRNLYFFKTADSPADQLIRRQFNVVYDPNKTNFMKFSAEINFEENNLYKSTLKGDYYFYQTKEFDKPFQRPSFTVNFENYYIVQEKLVLSFNAYILGGMYGYNPIAAKAESIDPIADLNLGADYSINPKISIYFKANNLINKKYYRYMYYPSIGFNFQGGIQVGI